MRSSKGNPRLLRSCDLQFKERLGLAMAEADMVRELDDPKWAMFKKEKHERLLRGPLYAHALTHIRSKFCFKR